MKIILPNSHEIVNIIQTDNQMQYIEGLVTDFSLLIKKKISEQVILRVIYTQPIFFIVLSYTKLSINNNFTNFLSRFPTMCASFTKLTSEAK